MTTILIADDVTDMRELLKSIVAGAGYTVVEAATGKEVLERIAERPDIALVLLDIGMPNMTGFEAIGQIHTIRPHSPPKVCFVSGSRDRTSIQKALAAGAVDYIVKPIDPTVTLMKIRKILGEGTPEAGFARLQTRLRGEFSNFPLASDLVVTEISEVGLTVESQLPFKSGGRLDITIPYLSLAFGCEAVFSCGIDRVFDRKGVYRLECSFVGLHESLVEKIRALAIKGTRLVDEGVVDAT